MKLVIVESPAKAKTINKYLGSDYEVLASYGHVRDLPAKDGSVKPDDDFDMVWEVGERGKKQMAEIVRAAKQADTLILATDPDREGEAISWHVLQILKDKKALQEKQVQRVVFNEITKTAITDAIAHPREIDAALVEAYLARRALDYLVGFTLSPVLWRKLPGSRSAGRVQSVALRLICERELEIESFVAREYWTVEADFGTGGSQPLTARLTRLDGQKVEKFTLGSAAAAEAAKARILTRDYAVAQVESKPTQRHPQPPFTTSTLQQEAARKLGFSASRTMQVAQRLYEGVDIDGETVGLITYMRTDGVSMAQEAITSCRDVIGGEYGADYLPAEARSYSSKAKNAQEAHEAVRPTDMARLPKQVAATLDKDQARLYELIWKRAIASQMASARLERTTIEIASADNQVGFRATGSVLLFDGFLKLYQEGTDDGGGDEEEAGRLPRVAAKQALALDAVRPDQHFTEPPPRFTEASLVKRMEELGIGRPSTYASILSVLRERTYVTMDKSRFVPEDKGRLVTAFLESFFTRYVEYDFTAALEEQLDEISAGK
ncbi:MAG TPA: type I DNA topoisomerase, partial [Alphaproteobacteria bacterium]|nr:type I DNA topoisomerase [Alphaproteobacteria bacterium]